MICEAVEAYLAVLHGTAPVVEPREEATDEPAATDDDLADAWFDTFDEAAHVEYSAEEPEGALDRVRAWLRGPRGEG